MNACLRRWRPPQAKMTKKSCQWKRQWIAVRESRKLEEVTAEKDAQSTEMEGGFAMCEIGGEQQSVRFKAPPQKRRANTRVESAEKQDYASEQGGLEELSQEETEDLVPNTVSEPQWALHRCDNKCREESFKFFQLAAICDRRRSSSHNQLRGG